MRYPEEPHVLVGGVPIHVGAVSMLQTLVASGHRVTLDAAGVVVVEPFDVPDDVAFLLDALDEDLAILLAAGGEPIH
jgi:hypothetical protein